MKAWEIVSDDGIGALALNEREMPVPGHGEILVEVGASSINYRDLSTVLAPAARNLPYPTIPNSDCAGTVTRVGPGVSGFAEGERVMGCFFADWISGPITPQAMASALGGAVDGVLAEYVVLKADGAVKVPDHLTLEEAATLPCAAVTAWHALQAGRPVTAGDTVLLLGTGGVSVFAQQFCNLLGAETIVTSSSDAKLQRMRDLGAGQTINYKTIEAWDAAVVDMTGGGVDRVIEVGGPGTLQKSITAARIGGTVALIGILTGAGGAVVPTDIMRKSLTVQGIYVGAQRMFQDMSRAIGLHQLHPVIDEVFGFEAARDAYTCMKNAGHFGKIVIRVQP